MTELTRFGLQVEVLGESEMQSLGMGALLGVGQGSRRESQLAILQWRGTQADPSEAPLAFVGKGVCFDAGGISLKQADRMEEMIIDMSGAAAWSAGAMYALAARKAPVNAVGILGLVETLPDGAAQRPGDSVKTISGQTVEVINTDAEGRLVLADALWYCQDRFKPQVMIDLATLTGAIMSALGGDIGGLFSNDERLAENILAASAATGERLWATAAAEGLRQGAGKPRSRCEARWRPLRRRDHCGAISKAVRQRDALGAPRCRNDGVEVEVDRSDQPRRRHRLWRAPARSAGGRLLRKRPSGQAGV